MGKIKAKQIAYAAPFTVNGSEALDIAATGITNSHLASGIDGSKISNATMPGSALTNTSVAGTKLMANTVGADKLEQSVLNMINRGTTIREPVLVVEQLIADGASSGIAPAALLAVTATLPTADDTLVIKDGTGTETFTFKAAASVAFEVNIGAGEAACADNIAAAINADSVRYSAVVETGLDKIRDPVVVIYRKVAVASGSETSRIYQGVGTSLRYIPFGPSATALRYDGTISTSGSVTNYTSTDLAALPTSDPTSANFGFGRALAGLIDGDLRFIMADNVGYAFDIDGNTWNLGLGSSIAAGSVGPTELNSSVAGAGLAGGGGCALSVNVDDTGIEINTDTLRLKDGGVVEAKLGATSVTAAKLGADVAGNGLTGGNGSALAVLAANTSVNVAAGGVKAAVPVKDDKSLNPSGAVSTDETDTGIDITKAPAAGSYVSVLLNGVKVELGDGVRTKDCYFSVDGGTTARAISSIAAADSLYWNAVVSGVSLSTADEIDLEYLNTTP